MRKTVIVLGTTSENLTGTLHGIFYIWFFINILKIKNKCKFSRKLFLRNMSYFNKKKNLLCQTFATISVFNNKLKIFLNIIFPKQTD